jgi:hypothetical protein
MNYSKILNWIFGITAFIGFILIIGAVGASDYAVEMHIYEAITAHMKEMVIGVILMMPGIIYLEIIERGDET